MADKENKLHIDPAEEKQYTFVQETIRPKRKNTWKKAIFTLGMAIVFGAVSCIIFCICLPLFSDYFQINNKQIIIGKSDGYEMGSEKTIEPTAVDTAPAPTATPSSAPTASEPVKTKKPNGKNGIADQPVAAAMSGDKMQKIYDKVNRSIVKVSSVKKNYDIFNNPSQDMDSTSGVVVGKSSTVLLIYVNLVRLGEGDELFVTFRNNTMVQASIYSKHNELGIAILAVPLNKLTAEEVQTIDIADFDMNDELETGEPVIALGNPNAHMYSLAYGYVANEPYNAYITDNAVMLVNTTVPFNSRGDGVIVNSLGKVVGFITHAAGFASNLNYDVNTCYSIQTIKPIITKLVNRKSEIYFGIKPSDITPEIAYKTSVNNGIYVLNVENNSPAFYADIKKGDIIIAINSVGISDTDAFNKVLNNFQKKDKVSVTFLRMVKGKQVQKKVNVQLDIKK